MTYNRKLIILAVAFVLVGAGSFYGGMLLQKSLQSPTTTAQASGNASQSGPGGGSGGYGGRYGSGGNRPTFGTVASITSTSMTVTTRSGSTTTVSFTDNPTVTDGSGNSSAVSDISTGDTVIVMGTAESDGTIDATQIRLNPTFGGYGGSSNSGTSTN